MKKNQTTKIGSLGEKIAANHLVKKGYKIIEMNYANQSGLRLGEIDIIAKENDEIVFVEVKTRNYKYINTLPEENITRSKLKKISKISNEYLHKNGLIDSLYRFDAISVWIDLKNKKAKIKHIKNMFL